MAPLKRPLPLPLIASGAAKQRFLLGRPIAGLRLFVLDSQNNSVDPGEAR